MSATDTAEPKVVHSASAGFGPRDWAVLAALGALVAGLCLHHLDARSIWLDEAVGMRIARTPQWGALVSDGGNMAAYYLFLKGWLALGTSEWVARFPSVVFSALGCVLLYLLARRLHGPRVAIVAALLLAVNSSVVRYGQEARSYALELLIVTASWWALSAALERRRMRWFLLWGLLSAAAVATHLFAFFVVPAQLASLALLPAKRLPWKGLVAGFGLAAVCAAPFLLIAARAGTTHISWIPEMSMESFRQILRFLGGDNFEPSPNIVPSLITVVVLATLTLGLAAGSWVAVRVGLRLGRSHQTWSYGMPVMWLVVPLVTVTIVSAVFQPLMVPRYFIALVPASTLLLAIAVSELQGRASAVALGLLVVLGIQGVARSYDMGEWGWRRAAAYLSEVARAGESVVVVPAHQRMPLDFYAEANPTFPALDFISPMKSSWRPPKPTVFGVSEAFYLPTSSPGAALLASQRSRFWLVFTDFIRWDGSGRVVEARAGSRTFFQHLPPQFVIRSGRGFGRVGVLLLESDLEAEDQQEAAPRGSGGGER
jgi:mannosyltransferase